MPRSRIVIFASFLLAFSGCGGGTDVPTAIPTGVYAGTGHFTGTITINGATSSFDSAPFVLGIVTAAGSYQLLSYSSGGPNVVSQVDRGSGSVVAGTFAGNNDIEAGMFPNYNSNAFPVLGADQGGALSATYVLNTSLTGTLNFPGTQHASLSLPLAFAAGSTSPATLGAAARTYSGAFYSNVNTGENINEAAVSTITIGATGAITGAVTCPFGSVNPPAGAQTPCTVSGTISPRTDVNAYDVSISFTNGTSTSFPSTWVGKTATGLGYLDSSGKLIFGAAAPDNTAFAFSN
jgi:hypothetical protein